MFGGNKRRVLRRNVSGVVDRSAVVSNFRLVRAGFGTFRFFRLREGGGENVLKFGFNTDFV